MEALQELRIRVVMKEWWRDYVFQLIHIAKAIEEYERMHKCNETCGGE